MPVVQVVVNEAADERVLQKLAATLRANDSCARELRDFADDLTDQRPGGLQFQPRPGQILVCRFGLGFQQPEIIKTRPVVVLSPHRRVWTRLVMVVPISSKRPDPIEPYHFQLPAGAIPGSRYPEAWVKGDLIMTVGSHRLDRLKTGFRRFESPSISAENLTEIRKCALHAAGLQNLTIHL